MQHIDHNHTFASAKGGTLDVLREGEIVAQIAVPPGLHKARRFVADIPPGFEVQVGEGLAVFAPKSGYGRQPYGEGSHETAANPSFEPTSASRLQAQLDQGLRRLATVESRVERKLKALQAVEVIPTAKREAEAEVVEDASPAPAPAPAKVDVE